MERRQVEIPFSRDKRLELIEQVKIPIKGSAPTRRKVRALLYHLEMQTGRDGCSPRVSTLAFLMGCDERTIKRVVARLRKAGLLATERKAVRGCGRENRYFVQWDRLASMHLNQSSAC